MCVLVGQCLSVLFNLKGIIMSNNLPELDQEIRSRIQELYYQYADGMTTLWEFSFSAYSLGYEAISETEFLSLHFQYDETKSDEEMRALRDRMTFKVKL